ncbi:hypothetical protein [Burkholderia multivorans]|jgi:hypothetical protein|uniref:hypothetical protein n=1 Tax=Burkholderia multivorans TaxID=87883 RepID=UPI001C23838B|nr:hypothetical protein [Burkholderia multivorans]MBU9366368.1 hypothetical protein [Burkholderia multivorans]
MRKNISNAINFAAVLAAIAVLWQAVRFCEGKIGMPLPLEVIGINLANNLANAAFHDVHAVASPSFIFTAWHYVIGVALWVMVAAAMLSGAESLARIVEVGWQQYRAEMKLEAEEYARQAKINAARERRREFRNRKKASGLSFGTLIVGIIVGSIFF